ncbi:hypothetical protein HYDPIDRAFT_42336 [Hydnomerulius pinastri MD-312]|uniref:CST complex subunit STN1 n=1 Tax=Hydnomerulius pinastri MD-312 TaxID=994086 RepID=A0A0C9VUT9_9AGAM|nr:hypothetical protein HYDPIDRAFT_42336 [Hydnomerulius pinastri MD-312]
MTSSTSSRPSAQDIWKWTLTKDSIAPCFVRDVLAMRESDSKDADFFWLGYTPCRTVLVVGMVVAVQVYDKRTLYTIDDGTAVIDCILRHPTPPKHIPITAPKRPSPKKPRIERGTKPSALDPPELPPPVTEPGYPVRVVGKVIKHYDSRQVFAESIDPCPSSLDEMIHWRRVIDLHKTKYSLAIPFVIPPPQPTSVSAHETSTTVNGDRSAFTSTAPIAGPGASNGTYTLPAPRLPPQNQSTSTSKVPPMRTTASSSAYGQGNAHAPSSPTAASIASSTPSSPCKTSSPVKGEFGEPPPKPKLRHPSRLHTRDLTANTFRMYVKHYMDNVPPEPPHGGLESESCRAESDGEEEAVVRTPTKRRMWGEDAEDGHGGRTPRASSSSRPRPHGAPPQTQTRAQAQTPTTPPTLGFTLSHLRRVPELALLAERVVRAETRRREKAEREKEKEKQRSQTRPASSSSKPSTTTPKPSSAAPKPEPKPKPPPPDPPHKKMKRLFAWAVVKLYEEGSIVLWDGAVRALPRVDPPSSSSLSFAAGGHESGLWKTGDGSILSTLSTSTFDPTLTSSSTFLFSSSSASASACLFSSSALPATHERKGEKDGAGREDPDPDPVYLSDPAPDEESYVPLTPCFLAGYVRGAVEALSRARGRGTASVRGGGTAGVQGGTASARGVGTPTPEDITAYLRRVDARWARVGVWAVEEALEVLNGGGV